MITDLKDNVLRIVASIPEGKVMTYGAVAKAAGVPGAARAVGAIMGANRDPAIPCHRVVLADGAVGGYNRGTPRKAARLRAEGVAISRGRVAPSALVP